jgi:predicted PurR-regulated permease PerM
MKNLELRLATMTTPLDAIKPQRVVVGSALVVGFILIYYAGAPFLPVLAGCVLVPAISILRSRLRGRR